MYWLMIIACAGFVSLLMIVIVHLIEEYRHEQILIGVMDQSAMKNILLIECEVLKAQRF